MTKQADIRRFMFANAQAALSSAELDMQGKQNEAIAPPSLSAITQKEHAASKQWFLEFMNDQHSNVDVESEYFTLGAPLPNVVVLKEYARYIVRSRRGQLSTKVSVKTVQSYMAMIISLIKRACGHRYMEPISQEIDNFIKTVLAPHEGLTTIMHDKPVAHSPDLTFILSKLYDPEYLQTFENMRTVLNLTLYMTMMVDTCGRGGELARNFNHEEHMCLRWQDVEFYTFQSSDNHEFDIRANVKIRWQKNQTLDESAYKTIALPGLLPPSFALEDTLRLLLNLAILDGTIDGVSKWDDLLKLRIPPETAKTGRRVRMVSEKLALPVFRRMKKHSLTTEPVQTVDLHPLLRHLGQFCGLQYRFTGYAIRRGVANVLADKTNEQNRMFLMGHTDRSSFAPYQSRISTIDFPAIFRGIEERAVLPQSSILLNRSDDAPVVLSEAGRKLVLQSDEATRARKLQDTAHRALLEKFDTIAAAKRAGDQVYHDYTTAEKSYQLVVNRLEKNMFKTEYKQHFSGLYATKVVAIDNDENNLVAVASTTAYLESTTDTAYGSCVKHHEGNAAACNDMCTSSALDAMPANAEVEGSEPLPVKEPPTERSNCKQTKDDRANPQQVKSKVTTALHGDAESSMGKGKSRLGRLKGISAYNDMVVDIQRCGGHDGDISATMTRWYSISHNIDQFFAGQEPLPGTYDCRFCGQDLRGMHHAHEHCYSCAKSNAMVLAEKLRMERFPLHQPCSYKFCGHGPAFQTFVDCGTTFRDIATQGDHMRNHVRSMQKAGHHGGKVLTCFFGSCAKNPKGGRLDRDGPDFETADDLLAHVWSVHNVCTLKAIDVFFCPYCDTWLLEPLEWRVHAERHLETAKQIVSALGYTGMSNGRMVIPRLCPFCFHDESLPIHHKIFPHHTMYELAKHMKIHMDKSKNAGE